MTPKRIRRRFTAECKAEVALAALSERQPLAALAARDQLTVDQLTVAPISRGKLPLRQQAAPVFAEPAGAAAPAGSAKTGAALRGYWEAAGGESAAKKRQRP